jgi:hypothetical protein
VTELLVLLSLFLNGYFIWVFKMNYLLRVEPNSEKGKSLIRVFVLLQTESFEAETSRMPVSSVLFPFTKRKKVKPGVSLLRPRGAYEVLSITWPFTW